MSSFTLQFFARINPSLRLLLWSCLVIGVLISAIGVRQVDLWWQLPEGISILRSGHLPLQPPAAFGLPAIRFVDEYGLYEIGLALIYTVGGFIGMGLAFMAIWLLIFFIPLMAARRRTPDVISLLLLALALLFMINRWEQRPEVAGVLCLVFLLDLLRRKPFRITPGFLLRLALLLTIWSNLHSSFVVGLLAVFLWLVDGTLVARKLSWKAAMLVATAAMVGVMLNPYGWHRIAFTLSQERDTGSNVLSQEMWPITSQSPMAMALLFIGAGVVIVAVGGRKRPPLWLIGLAVMTVLMSLLSLRHISFLAAALLTLYSERQTRKSDETPLRTAWFIPLQSIALGACCILALIFDFNSLYQDVRHAIYRHSWGREDQGFAPALVNVLRSRCVSDTGVLCDYGEGSYLTFAGGGRLRPLLDSGQGHFSDETKRSYFFIVHQPEAFDLALSHLAVDYVLITRPVAGWTPLLAGRTGWRLITCDGHGLIFERTKESVPLNVSERAQIGSLRDAIDAKGDPLWAFCYSSLIDPSPVSLAILDRSNESAWTEPFLNNVGAWMNQISSEDLNSFLKNHAILHNLLLQDLISMRTGIHIKPTSVSLYNSQLGQALRILTLLEQGDLGRAKKDFAVLSKPMASTLYYELRDRIQNDTGLGAPRCLICLDYLKTRDNWQDWNHGGRELIKRLAPDLNRQLPTSAR